MIRVVDSPIGIITLEAASGVISGLNFGEQAARVKDTEPYAALSSRFSDEEALQLCEEELAQYFDGKLQDFSVPFHAHGTAFRQKVWAELCRIPYGKTASYLDIAKAISSPKAVRAVGGANHNNPISIIIPCHRVIGSDGRLVGYGGGLEIKRVLLELEQQNPTGYGV